MVLSVKEMISRYYNNSSHPDEVRRLCMLIFDEITEKVKELPNNCRKYLEAAALLHDIGYYIDSKKHNIQSQRLIIENELKDFTTRETEIIACICRYHRGSLPKKKKDEIYKNFTKEERKIVKQLGGILRIADGIDRVHLNLIKKVKLNFDENNRIIEFILTTNNPEYKPDITYAIKKRELFEKGFKCQCVFKFQM